MLAGTAAVDCHHPDGSESCAFYVDCLEPAHPCGPTGYTQAFAMPFCEQFLAMSREPTTSVATKSWLRGVRQCLQDTAVAMLSNDTLSCDELGAAAFASHVFTTAPPPRRNGARKSSSCTALAHRAIISPNLEGDPPASFNPPPCLTPKHSASASRLNSFPPRVPSCPQLSRPHTVLLH